MRTYAAKEDSEQFIKKVRSFDSNIIPLCWISLQQKIFRTIFVNSMWLHATDSECTKLQLENCGWHLDSYLKPTGFIGDQTPLRIQDIVEMTEDTEESAEYEDLQFPPDDSDTE